MLLHRTTAIITPAILARGPATHDLVPDPGSDLVVTRWVRGGTTIGATCHETLASSMQVHIGGTDDILRLDVITNGRLMLVQDERTLFLNEPLRHLVPVLVFPMCVRADIGMRLLLPDIAPHRVRHHDHLSLLVELHA